MKNVETFLVIFLCVLFSQNLFAKDTWNLTELSGSCGNVSNICITLNKMKVTKTPNDAGNYEEWKMTASTYVNRLRFEVSVKDKLSNAKFYNINKKVCIPFSRVTEERGIFTYEIVGYEDDRFDDDPIPKLDLYMRDINCTDNISAVNSGKDGMNTQWCKYSSDYKRFACYYLSAEYLRSQSSVPSGPTPTEPVDTECGRIYQACVSSCDQAGKLEDLCKGQCKPYFENCGPAK